MKSIILKQIHVDRKCCMFQCVRCFVFSQSSDYFSMGTIHAQRKMPSDISPCPGCCKNLHFQHKGSVRAVWREW